MSGFKDLVEVLDPHLPLPISGKLYRVPSPNVLVGLRAQATVTLAAKVRTGEDISEEDVASLKLNDEEEAEFTQQMLGKCSIVGCECGHADLAVFDEMQADGLPWEYVRHAAKTVFMWLVSDRDAAEKVWSSLGNAPRPAPQDRRPKKTAGSTKTATSKSSSTKKTSRRTPASRGTASSGTGD